MRTLLVPSGYTRPLVFILIVGMKSDKEFFFKKNILSYFSLIIVDG